MKFFGNAKKAVENLENFFGISESFDIGRSLENILGKFRKFVPRSHFVHFVM